MPAPEKSMFFEDHSSDPSPVARNMRIAALLAQYPQVGMAITRVERVANGWKVYYQT